MYRFKNSDVVSLYNKEQVAKIIGLNPTTLRRIFSGKQTCSKIVAYSITKFINTEDEIEEYFDFVEKGE